MSERKVTIIILTWNCLDYTKKCLISLKKITRFSQYEVIVVDNGSSDGTIEYLESLDWITLIRNEKNEGFVKGNNIGISHVKDDSDIILLNNDIIITQADWIQKMQKAAYSSDKVGLVGCRLINEKKQLLHTGTRMYPETFWGQQIGGGQIDINQYSLTREVEGVVFACVYIKNNVLNDVGVLDEDYFSYFEDTDYCFKVREKGYSIISVGDVTLVHYQNVSTNMNNVNFSDMFKTSQKIFIKKWGKKIERKYANKLAWHSIVNFPSGYAVSSKNIMMALDKQNVDVRYKYVYGKGTPFPVEEPKLSDEYIINIICDRKFDTSFPQVVYGQGDVFYKNNGKYKIGYTMLEVTGLPKEWVAQCNKMDEVWVPSRFNVETFANSGVKVPIKVIPLGIDPNYFNKDIKSFKKHTKFTYLSVFEWGERKCPEKLLRAFANEFKPHEDVVLICKVINNDGSININEEIKKLNLPENHAEIIFLYNQKIPGYQMGALYRSADCFVLPTRGEGWGMPILEAMACGLPVISTNWSSQTDFINENNAYLLKVEKLVDARAKCPYYQGFQWADPDENHLRYLMRYVYEHQDEAKEKGLIAARECQEKWTWDHVAYKILERLQEIG